MAVGSWVREDASVPIGLMEFVEDLLRLHGLEGNEQVTLADAGVDSLTLVELLDRLEPFDDGIDPDRADVLADGAVLQRLSIAELVAIAAAIDNGGDVSQVLEPYVAIHGEEARRTIDAMMRRDAQLGDGLQDRAPAQIQVPAAVVPRDQLIALAHQIQIHVLTHRLQ